MTGSAIIVPATIFGMFGGMTLLSQNAGPNTMELASEVGQKYLGQSQVGFPPIFESYTDAVNYLIFVVLSFRDKVEDRL